MVDEAHQDHKIGTQLLERVESKLRKYPSIGRLFVSTESNNTKAIKFYEARGFKKEGVLSNYYADGEHEMILGKALRAKPSTA
jgi:ribosomal protein S18 acetylase RimI-like enzyme